VFVPKKSADSPASPYIDERCNPASSSCQDDVYPFICVSKDAKTAGDEITTVRQLLNGRYEYWIELMTESPAGDVTVTLKNTSGAAVRSWSSPANTNLDGGIELGWHVFDLDGATGNVTSVDETTDIDDYLPNSGHDPNDNVCP